MADLTITAANVAAGANAAPVNQYLAGAAITQGQAVYVDSTTNTVKLADADALDTSAAKGVALNAASIGQPITYQRYGNITIGATVVPGKAYYVSTTPGAICLESDLSTGDFPHLLGFATSTTVIALDPKACGVAKA
jgi:surface antigen